MKIHVLNQTPTVLTGLHAPSFTGDFDPVAHLHAVAIEPILNPLSPTTPVSITNGRGKDLIPSLDQMLLDTLGETHNAAAETVMKKLYSQTLRHYVSTTTLPTNEIIAAQCGNELGLPDPSPNVVYHASNAVIPSAKDLLASTGTPEQFFAGLAYTYSPETLGFWFKTASEFDALTQWIYGQIPMLQGLGTVDGSVITKLNSFVQIKLKDLTESLVIRSHDDDDNHEGSFARVLAYLLHRYTLTHRTQMTQAGTPTTMGLLPFHLGELAVPHTIVMVNVEAHARATASAVTHEWSAVKSALSQPLTMLSTHQVTKLGALQRAAKKATSQAATSQSNRAAQAGRSAGVPFRKKAPTTVNLYGAITKALRRMGQVNRSQNLYRKTKISFARANRRDPDDFNRPGKSTTTIYLPDIHIYLDTSGSISEENYQDAAIMLIKLAKRLNINLYVSSFSHVLSQETLLKTANRSTKSIWRSFRAIPKVNGGTDFEQIWRYIMASPTRLSATGEN